MSAIDLEAMRQHYTRDGLDLDRLSANPFAQFKLWFDQACQAGLLEPNAMSVATASASGRPSLRTALLKQFDERGFVFFTNYESRKAREIAENPNIALLFPWIALERQCIVTGSVEKLSAEDSFKYFVKRPVDSQLSAWASPQSRTIPSRHFLEMEIQKVKEKFADGKIPLPPFWGGFRVIPREMEFWQGGAYRTHDRFLYTRMENGWRIERLAP